MSLTSRILDRSRWLATALASILTCGHAAAADLITVQLRNGDRITGVILSESTNAVTFRTTWHNVLVLPASEIAQRGPATPAPQQAAVGKTPAVPGSPKPAVLPGTAPTPELPPVSPAQTEYGVKHLLPGKFSGEAQVGTDLLFSEKSRSLLSGRLKLVHTYDRLSNLADYHFAYGRTDRVLSDHRMFGSVKTDYQLPHRFFLYNLGVASYDEIRRVDFRYEIGPGIGYHMVRHPKFTLNAEMGWNYQAQYLADGTDDSSFGLRWAEDAVWKVHSRLTLDQRAEFIPKVEDFTQYRFRLEGNARLALAGSLALVLTVMDEYETRTVAGIPSNDLQIRSSLSVRF